MYTEYGLICFDVQKMKLDIFLCTSYYCLNFRYARLSGGILLSIDRSIIYLFIFYIWTDIIKISIIRNKKKYIFRFRLKQIGNEMKCNSFLSVHLEVYVENAAVFFVFILKTHTHTHNFKHIPTVYTNVAYIYCLCVCQC